MHAWWNRTGNPDKLRCAANLCLKTVGSLEQIQALERPAPNPLLGDNADVIRDILWSDPTDSDDVVGKSQQGDWL